MKAIASAANPIFRRWLRIARTPREARVLGQTLAEGIHLAQAALGCATPVDAVVLRRGTRHRDIETLLERFSETVPRYELSAELYDRIAPVDNGAGLLLVVPIAERTLPRASRADAVYLDGVQDPGNVGALIRIAAAAGVAHVLAATGTAALWSPKALRAGMGAHFRVGLYERIAPSELAQVLDGVWIAAVAHEAPSLWEQDLPRAAVGWVFGSEGAGPSPQALAVCQRRLRIPTSTSVESLNVAAAAAVCLFERLRRR